MRLSEINPYIRYARTLLLDETSYYTQVTPLDARLFYVLAGYGRIQVDEKVYEMPLNTLLIINSGVAYTLLTPETTVEYIAVNFDYTQNASSLTVPIRPVSTPRFREDMLVDFNTFEDAAALSTVLYIREIEGIRKKLASLVREQTQKLLYYEQKTGHMLAECIADSVRHQEIGRTNPEKAVSNRILSYIHSNYSADITNRSIGEQFGYHPNYVSALIREITGMPVHRYVIHIRLMNAASFLENTSMSIGEIASACGFCDAAYFSGYFKKYFGISPSKYRNT